MFILSPNGTGSVGDNRDKFVPRPDATTPLHVAMYEYLGKMMGLAIRTRELLALDLPSMVWKALIGDDITDSDVLAIDILSFKIIEQMNDPLLNEDEFNSVFADTKFVIAGSDTKEYELIPKGRQKTLNWQNKQEFCDALVRYRKTEFTPMCEAMRRGLATIVPYTLLSLFTWEELQIQVCGKPTMNLDLLQKMTTYQGVSSNDLHIRFFWEIMKNRFDDVERGKFLKFVWGRSRLPVRAQDFETRFKITASARVLANPDNYMPVAHTCFFSIEMPAYTNIDIMHKRLMYAMTHCDSFEIA